MPLFWLKAHHLGLLAAGDKLMRKRTLGGRTQSCALDIPIARSRREVRVGWSDVRELDGKSGVGLPRLRRIEVPNPFLRAIQLELLRMIEREALFGPEVFGGHRKKGPLLNVAQHIGADVLVRFDIEDFFPAVSADRIRDVLTDVYSGADGGREWDASAVRLGQHADDKSGQVASRRTDVADLGELKSCESLTLASGK